jgi:tRNA-splicing ligase RtcB
VDLDSAEGERLMLANTMAMNYGFAFRLSAYATFRKLLAESFGAVAARLIVDSPHNSIYQESVGGQMALVHRHNACRVYPAAEMNGHSVYGKIGRPLLLPGTNRTSSYVCVPGEGSARALNSACHGAGTTIKQLVRSGLSRPDPLGRRTERFDYSNTEPTEVPQLDDRGVDEAVRILEKSDVVRPVARLRPFAVLN